MEKLRSPFDRLWISPDKPASGIQFSIVGSHCLRSLEIHPNVGVARDHLGWFPVAAVADHNWQLAGRRRIKTWDPVSDSLQGLMETIETAL